MLFFSHHNLVMYCLLCYYDFNFILLTKDDFYNPLQIYRNLFNLQYQKKIIISSMFFY